MAKAFLDDDVVMICKPVIEGLPMASSVARQCGLCKQMVWLSESTARQAGECGKACCIECALKHDVMVGNKFEEPSFETRREVSEAIGRKLTSADIAEIAERLRVAGDGIEQRRPMA